MVRRCEICGKIITEGYCIADGQAYYCSDECLHKHYTQEEFDAMYADGEGDSYWTEWEPEDGDTFFVARDKDDSLCLFKSKPYYDADKGTWMLSEFNYGFYEIPDDLFPQVDKSTEPMEVRIVPREYIDKLQTFYDKNNECSNNDNCIANIRTAPTM